MQREVGKMTVAAGFLLIPIPARASLIQPPKFHLEWKDKTFSSISSASTGSSRAKTRRWVSVSTNFCCNSLLADLGPPTSVAYGALLLGGGVFACNLSSFLFHKVYRILCAEEIRLFCILRAVTRSGSKGSLFGGFTGAALMATVSVMAALFLNYYTLLR